MFGKSYDIGKEIARRVKGIQVWDSLPKKILKKHPKSWVLCQSFKVRIPKVMTKEVEEIYHAYRIQFIGETHGEIMWMIDYMIQCGHEIMAVGDRAFWLHAVTKHEIQRKGSEWRTALTYIFRLRKLSLTEQKNLKLTEEKNG